MKIQQMTATENHWNSKALILLGMWLWEQGEYGHALLCMHGPHWGIKIGTQLKISWHDVINSDDDGFTNKYFYIPGKDEAIREICDSICDNILTAYHTLPIDHVDNSMYMNYKTGNPLTSSTLNRELQKFSENFLEDIKVKTGIALKFKPLKTNAFEIAWALDMVYKYSYSKQVFSAVSKTMGHRTLKDTIELLEVSPIENIEISYDLIKNIPSMIGSGIFDDEEKLKKFVSREVRYGL